MHTTYDELHAKESHCSKYQCLTQTIIPKILKIIERVKAQKERKEGGIFEFIENDVDIALTLTEALPVTR